MRTPKSKVIPFAFAGLMVLSLSAGLASRALAQQGQGQGPKSEAELKNELAAAEASPGENNVRLFEALISYGDVLVSGENTAEGRSHLERAASLAETSGDAFAGGHARALFVLAELDMRENRMDEAMARLQKAQAVVEKAGLKEKMPGGIVASNMGSLMMQKGQAPQALPLLEQAAKVFEANKEEAVGRRATTNLQLGSAYLQTGNETGAEQAFLKAMEAAGEIPAEQQGFVKFMAALSLADVCVTSNRPDEAKKHLEIAASLSSSPNVGQVPLARMHAIQANLAVASGSVEEAESHYQKALGIADTLQGPQRQVAAGFYKGYANFLRSQGKEEEATKAEQKAAAMR